MLALPASDLPQTITTSYGDDEQTVPPDYANTVCGMLAQLGARGVSLLFASGDGGVGGGQGGYECLTNDGTNRTQFIPTFPASCELLGFLSSSLFLGMLTEAESLPCRPVGHHRRRNGEHQPRSRLQLLRRRVLELLRPAQLPVGRRRGLHSKHRGRIPRTL